MTLKPIKESTDSGLPSSIFQMKIAKTIIPAAIAEQMLDIKAAGEFVGAGSDMEFSDSGIVGQLSPTAFNTGA